MPTSKYQPGQRYGLLTLLHVVPSSDRKTKWVVRCDCGITFTCRVDNFTRPNPKCSDCRYKLRPMPQRTHGQSGTGLYKRWAEMIQRCHNPKSAAYHRYGKRGISVCQQWRDSFEMFIADMGLPPNNKYSIERKDNNGNYEPNNCIWDTRKQQGRNKRTNHLVTIKDQTKTIAEWAEISGINYDTILGRLMLNWPSKNLLDPPLPQGQCLIRKKRG